MAKSFEDLSVFRAATQLMTEVYRLTESYPRQEVYGLVAQMRRASVSVVSHIAEGQGRLTIGEWRQLLSHARGSLYELEAQLIASHRLGYLDDVSYRRARRFTFAVGALLAGFIRYVRNREADSKHRKPAGNRQQATGNP